MATGLTHGRTSTPDGANALNVRHLGNDIIILCRLASCVPLRGVVQNLSSTYLSHKTCTSVDHADYTAHTRRQDLNPIDQEYVCLEGLDRLGETHDLSY